MSVQTVSLTPTFADMAQLYNGGGLPLWEFTYRPYQKVPAHEHEHAYVCFLIGGDTREFDKTTDITYSRKRLMYVPRGQKHSAQIGPRGAKFIGFEIGNDFFHSNFEADELPDRPRQPKILRSIISFINCQ